MDEEIERLVISVRADTAAFAKDVGEMRASLEGPLVAGVDRAGRVIEGALSKAIRTGKIGFDDLRKVALSVLAEIASAALKSGLRALIGGERESGSGLVGAIAGLAGGAPGRATGGPVSPGRAYRVGERGPELFVPTSSGQVVANGGSGWRGPELFVPTSSGLGVPSGSGGGGRDVRIAITVNGGSAAPEALARSSRQVARAVKAALAQSD